jgi:hypothetical protein
MRIIIILLACAGMSLAHKNRTRLPPPDIPNNENKVEEYWHTQLLDHFNPSERRTYQQVNSLMCPTWTHSKCVFYSATKSCANTTNRADRLSFCSVVKEL